MRERERTLLRHRSPLSVCVVACWRIPYYIHYYYDDYYDETICVVVVVVVVLLLLRLSS
jgi:hypothetical protein